MQLSFIVGTALASVLMFAGVWKATAPAPIVLVSAADPVTVPSVEIALPAKPTASVARIAAMRPVPTAQPYNVVRSAYGSPGSVDRSSNTRTDSSIFYSGCRAVRAAGAAPLYRGQPGYRPGMDGDNDGIACEPYR